MKSSDLAFLVPDATDLLARPAEAKAMLILELLAREHTSPETAVSHSNFFNRAGDVQFPPKYGGRQREVDEALMEAWSSLESRGLIVKSPSSAGNWFFVSNSGKTLLKRNAHFKQLETLGLDRVKSELNKERPRIGTVGGGSIEKDWTWEWVRMKENKPPVNRVVAGEWVLIAESRLDELRALTSPLFDFRKLIRLCEELNIISREECHFATAALTRALVDHVPPLFGKKNFSEVTNNYAGTKSFREAMEHLDNAAKKVADGHLHTQIRKSETLPTAQQVNFASGLDVLLSEIVRITK